MKKKTNLLEMLVWAALVSVVVMAPAHSQALNQQIMPDQTWSNSFDMGASQEASQTEVANSSGASGEMGHQPQQGPVIVHSQPQREANLQYANNGNITRGSWFGNTNIGSAGYSFGFNGGAASMSPFGVGLPATGTGSVNVNITNGY